MTGHNPCDEDSPLQTFSLLRRKEATGMSIILSIIGAIAALGILLCSIKNRVDEELKVRKKFFLEQILFGSHTTRRRRYL